MASAEYSRGRALQVGLWDLEFELRPVRFYSEGIERRRMVQTGMPKIPQDVLNCTFFLYKTFEEANLGVNPRGTGVLIHMAATVNPAVGFTLAVTNWHVALKDGASVIRLRTVDGGYQVFEKDPAEWLFDPNGDDLAVTPMSRISPETHAYKTIPFGLFASENWCRIKEIGVGDDAFMLGLLIDSGKHETGIPTARFGHISMMPGEATKIAQDNGSKRPSFVMDMHSRGGYSGSPVFVYRTPGSNLDDANNNVLSIGQGSLLSLLGLHWGQFPEEWRLSDSSSPGGTYVTGLSGLTCVIPAWRVREFIETHPVVVREYAALNARLAADPASKNTARGDSSDGR